MDEVTIAQQVEERLRKAAAKADNLSPFVDISPPNGRGEPYPLPVRSPSQEELAREFKKSEIIRPELNIEKHADFIFAPSHSKNLNKPRSRTWFTTLTDGTQVKASIIVEPFRGKIPTTKTHKVFLVLQKLWEEKGWNDEERTTFSAHEITDALGIKWAGKKSLREIENELLQLRWTPILWKHSFVDERGVLSTLKGSFSILDDFVLFTKEDRNKNQLYLALSSFRFHEEIRKNLKANRTKPTNLVALEIQGEIASVLYAHLDIILADKDHYERTTAGLLEDLRLEGEDFHKPSVRKRKIEKVIKELRGKPISTGILHLALEKTKDGRDWKLVARKTSLKKKNPKIYIGKPVEPANPPETIPHLTREMGDTLGGLPKYHRLYEKILKAYPYEMVFQALSEWRADGGRDADRPIAFFLAILHRLAHFRGNLWIKPCSSDCKHRLQD